MQKNGLQYTSLVKSWTRYQSAMLPNWKEHVSLCSQLIRSHSGELMQTVRSASVSQRTMNFCSLTKNLLDVLTIFIPQLTPTSVSKEPDCILLFIFAATWSLGGSLDDSGRKQFHYTLQKKFPRVFEHTLFQGGKLIYDVYFSVQKNGIASLCSWKVKVPRIIWNSPPSQWHSTVLPTEVRNNYLI